MGKSRYAFCFCFNLASAPMLTSVVMKKLGDVISAEKEHRQLDFPTDVSKHKKKYTAAGT